MLSPRRDLIAAKMFLRLALSGAGSHRGSSMWMGTPRTDLADIPVGGFEVYPFEMQYGEELVIVASANQAVNILVSERKGFEEWRQEREQWGNVPGAFVLPYPPFAASIQKVRASRIFKFSKTVSQARVVSVFNSTSERSHVKVEIVHWSSGE